MKFSFSIAPWIHEFLTLLSPTGNFGVVTAKDLKATSVGVCLGDIAIVSMKRSDRMRDSRYFWEHMVYLSADAAGWLIERNIKALSQDFMTCDSPLLLS